MATQAPPDHIYTSNLLGGRWVLMYVQGIRERSKKYVTAWGISFFVLGVVFSDGFAEYALVRGLIDFLTSIQEKGLPYAAVTINLMEGLTSLLAILGALLSDARLGRYRLILLSVPCYILGLSFFTLTASEKLSSAPRANTAVFYIALLFIAAGQGGQRHTLRAFGFDQFQSHIRDSVRKARIHTRAWWYLGRLVGVLAGITVNSFLSQEAIDRDEPKLNWEFGGISSLSAMVVTLILFVSGTFLFTRIRPQGSPLSRVLRVFLAALRNRHLPYPESARALFEEGHESSCGAPDQRGHGNYDAGDGSRILIEDDPQLPREKLNEDVPYSKERGEESALSAQRGNDQSEEIVPAGGASLSSKMDPPVNVNDPLVAANLKDRLFLSLPHSRGLRCLDKAAIRDPSQDVAAQIRKWKLCTVTQVEETKVLFRMFPIWTTFLMYGVVSSMGNTFFLEQGGNLDRRLRSQMAVPLTALQAFSGFSDVVTTQFLLPLLNRVLKQERGIPPEIRIGIGLLISILCCITAAKVEAHRLNVVSKKGLIDKPDETVPMSVFFLVPQFVLLGVMEGFAGDGLSDFFNDHVPPQMRVYEQLSSESVMGTGSLISALLIFITTVASKLGGKSSWFQDTTNASRLNLFYWLIAILSGVNLLLYVFIAVKHNPHKLPALLSHRQEEEEEDNAEKVASKMEEILDSVWPQ